MSHTKSDNKAPKIKPAIAPKPTPEKIKEAADKAAAQKLEKQQRTSTSQTKEEEVKQQLLSDALIAWAKTVGTTNEIDKPILPDGISEEQKLTIKTFEKAVYKAASNESNITDADIISLKMALPKVLATTKKPERVLSETLIRTSDYAEADSLLVPPPLPPRLYPAERIESQKTQEIPEVHLKAERENPELNVALEARRKAERENPELKVARLREKYTEKDYSPNNHPLNSKENLPTRGQATELTKEKLTAPIKQKTKTQMVIKKLKEFLKKPINKIVGKTGSFAVNPQHKKKDSPLSK